MDDFMTTPLKQPTWRKPAGMLVILLIILLVAGTIWIAPMRPLMIWMETGSFRAPPQA
jgi:hypothetical protein